MADKFCMNCDYWTRVTLEGPGVPGIPGAPSTGECKRYAPHPTVGSGHQHVLWPVTGANQFCGEWSGSFED
ncbi:MAG: hypothetical protein AAGL49_05305 [Pseudomonadota bacterium]